MTKSPYVKGVVPPDWKEAIEQAAAQSDQTVSQWVALACFEKLPARQQRKLSELNDRGRPKHE